MAETERPADPNLVEFSDERLMGFDSFSEETSDNELIRVTEDCVGEQIQPPRRPTTWFDCTRTLTDPYSNYGNSERDLF